MVDDHAMVRSGITRFLSANGYRVLTAASGNEALHLAANTFADVALVDFNMPYQDGLSVIAELRTVSPRTRCILWTASLTPELELKARLLEVAAIVEKPIDDMEAFLRLL